MRERGREINTMSEGYYSRIPGREQRKTTADFKIHPFKHLQLGDSSLLGWLEASWRKKCVWGELKGIHYKAHFLVQGLGKKRGKL